MVFTLTTTWNFADSNFSIYEEGGFCRVFAAFLCEDHINAQEGNFSFFLFVYNFVENFLSVFVGCSFVKV